MTLKIHLILMIFCNQYQLEWIHNELSQLIGLTTCFTIMKTLEDASSICASIGNFTKSCNKNIIQSIESQSDRDIFSRRIHHKLIPHRDNDNSSDGETVATTVCISMNSTSDSDRDEKKHEIEDSYYESQRKSESKKRGSNISDVKSPKKKNREFATGNLTLC